MGLGDSLIIQFLREAFFEGPNLARLHHARFALCLTFALGLDPTGALTSICRSLA